MWEMRAACIILADVVVVSDICIESGRQGEGGAHVQIVCQYQTNSNYNTQDKSLFLQLSVISFFGCCGLLIPTLQSPWFVHWTWETLVKAGSSSD